MNIMLVIIFFFKKKNLDLCLLSCTHSICGHAKDMKFRWRVINWGVFEGCNGAPVHINKYQELFINIY